MPSRDDEECVRHRSAAWEDQAPVRTDEEAGFQPWRRKSNDDPGSTDQRQGTAFGSGGWGGGYGPETPSGYSGPSGTGYGQTSPSQSGYGSTAFRTASSSWRVYGADDDHPPSGVRSADRIGPRLPADITARRPDGYDVDYQQWRDEQLRKLDQDYLTWRQARYRQFADEFNAWRLSRQDTAGTVHTDSLSPAPAPGNPIATDTDARSSPPAAARVPPSSSHPQ